MRIAILGDIVGTPGRQAVTQLIPTLRERWSPDLILANVENAANGSGLTPDLYKKLSAAGVDGMTLGDHAFKKQQIAGTLEREANLIRPANLAAGAAGRGTMRLTTRTGVEVYVVTVLGRLFMSMPADDPFARVERFLADLPPRAVVLVEIHAEATSEKVAMGWRFNGRVACVFGTHTHVQTADARVLPAPGSAEDLPAATPASVTGGTAYITDLGMCGPMDSVLGRRVDRVVKHMTTAMPAPFDVATGRPAVHGVVVDIDESTGRARGIETIALDADTHAPPFVS